MCIDIYRQELLHRPNNISVQISDKLITQKNTIHIQIIKNNVTQYYTALFYKIDN